MEKIFSYSHGITHAGIFHADDVFSTALCCLLNPEFSWKRLFSVPADVVDNDSTIIYDIGMGEFDHHQVDKKVRDDGIPYAAFGLLWREYGQILLANEEDWSNFDSSFVEPIDACDNGVDGFDSEVSRIVGDFNPVGTGITNAERDARFREAVDMAKTILKNRFERINSARRDFDLVRSWMRKGEDVLVMPEYRAWQAAVIGSGYTYVIYPSERGGFNVQGVPTEPGSFDTILPFPEAWRGRRDDDLSEETGVAGSVFCHASGFLVVAKTLEEAKELARLSLNQAKKEGE